MNDEKALLAELTEKGASVEFEHFRRDARTGSFHSAEYFQRDSRLIHPLDPCGGETRCRITWADGSITEGRATCRPDESFNRKLGRLISLGRALDPGKIASRRRIKPGVELVLRELDRNPAHVRVGIYVGPYHRTHAHAGVVTLGVEEWDALAQYTAPSWLLIEKPAATPSLYDEFAVPAEVSIGAGVGPGPGRDHE